MSDVVVGLVLGAILAVLLTADLVPESWDSWTQQYKVSGANSARLLENIKLVESAV